MLILNTCRKKTTVKVKLFNPALNEYVANASVVLIERKGESGGILGGTSSCQEIATAVTDEHGECHFDEERLRKNEKYRYFCAVKESWGISQGYPCAGKSDGFLKKGQTETILVIDEADGILKVQYNNLLNPSQAGDSLVVGISTLEYKNPKGGIVQGGGGIFGSAPYYNVNNPPNNPPVLISPPIKVKGQKLKRYVRKRKMGIMTISVDTIKVYPGTTTIVEIDW